MLSVSSAALTPIPSASPIVRLDDADAAPPARTRTAWVLAASGAIGFLLGALRAPTWHDALEPAQVLAGLVHYPTGNPVYLYSTHTWTVLHQIFALLLRWGCSERALALALSGIAGMLSLQALGLIIFTLSGDLALSIIGPFAIYFADAAIGGITYPLDLMGSQATYGVVGLSYFMLTIAPIGAGQLEWGGLLLGFGPAIHLAIGAWGVLIIAIAAAIDLGNGKTWRSRALPYFAAGTGATLVSALVHHLLRRRTGASPYLPALVEHWNDHRLPFPLLAPEPLLIVVTTGLVVLWLTRYRRDLTAPARGLLQLLLIATIVASLMTASLWFVPADVPNVIAWSMPSRLLNANRFAWMAILLGLCARDRDDAWMQVTLAALMLLAPMNPLPRDGTRHMTNSVLLMVSTIALVASAERRRRHETIATRPVIGDTLRRAALVSAAILCIAVVVRASQQFSTITQARMRDRSNDAVLASAAGRSGLLLTGGDLHMIQLATRRPILLDGLGTDGLVYVPEATPETARIMRRVYGVDLAALKRTGAGGFDRETGRALWEARAPAEWKAIAQEFGVTDVLTYADWGLRLPVISRNDTFVLFELPR